MFSIFFILTQALFATEVPQHIQDLTGCFKVDYRFYEDAKHNYEIIGALERIDLTEKDGVYTLQHYGIHEGEEMKHWREDWKLDAFNRWTQKVYGPSGNFRYECMGKIEMNQIRCLSKGAPKPLRDIKRKDYDVLDRETTLQFTSTGWVQAERNFKTPKNGSAIAAEVGWIEYKRVEDALCKVD